MSRPCALASQLVRGQALDMWALPYLRALSSVASAAASAAAGAHRSTAEQAARARTQQLAAHPAPTAQQLAPSRVQQHPAPNHTHKETEKGTRRGRYRGEVVAAAPRLCVSLPMVAAEYVVALASRRVGQKQNEPSIEVVLGAVYRSPQREHNSGHSQSRRKG